MIGFGSNSQQWLTSVALGLVLGCQVPAVSQSLGAQHAEASSGGPSDVSAGVGEVRWFEDDAEQALVAAQREKRLVFADLWAPWCHTCLSMRQQVLDAEQVPELAGLVLLAIDTERAKNEEFLRQFPIGVWPTFYVIDPATREVRGRWLGGATAQRASAWYRKQ